MVLCLRGAVDEFVYFAGSYPDVCSRLPDIFLQKWCLVREYLCIRCDNQAPLRTVLKARGAFYDTDMFIYLGLYVSAKPTGIKKFWRAL